MRNMNPKWRTWLRTRIKDNYARPGDIPLPPLGALTGQDARCLSAIAACWELYAGSDEDGGQAALAAVQALLPGMQEKCRPFARELIAFALDWTDREKLWPLVQR